MASSVSDRLAAPRRALCRPSEHTACSRPSRREWLRDRGLWLSLDRYCARSRLATCLAYRRFTRSNLIFHAMRENGVPIPWSLTVTDDPEGCGPL
ncbi:hypothetical protein MPLB_1500007 [Mesorhizobium sp. ORS 3324]|nr:hypothetical protein MPLB_1500007 [Mesorhizobium sp. ORS 3324]